MKSTGIARPLDRLGRVVLPKELRDVIGIKKGDPLEIFIDTDRVILRKFLHNCIFCGKVEDVWVYRGIAACRDYTEGLCKMSR